MDKFLKDYAEQANGGIPDYVLASDETLKAIAGLDKNGNIAPPPAGVRIDRELKPWWNRRPEGFLDGN